MRIHIFTSENFYTSTFLNFLGKNFGISDDLIVFRKKSDFGFRYHENLSGRILYPRSNLDFFFQLHGKLKKCKSIFMHQLPYGPSLIYWNLFSGLLKKTTWIIWGGDVYIYKRAGENIRTGFYESLRKTVIKKVPRIASFLRADYDLVKDVYGIHAEYFPTAYPLPTDIFTYERKSSQVISRGRTSILLGNSGDPSNLHLEAIEKLGSLKGKDIVVYCPLSYSGSAEYINKVIKAGIDLFGQNFIPITELMNPGKYLEFLDEIDIAIMNHERQQGLGNVIPLLFFGKKVYLREKTTSYDYFKKAGCILFSIPAGRFDSTLTDIRHNELISNRMIIAEMMSEKSIIDRWKSILSCTQL